MLISILMIIAGLGLLFAGGEILVTSSVKIARRLGLGEVFIGIVLIGFGTSAPEMLATARAALLGDAGLALGNVIGSNIANVGLITAMGLLLVNASQLKGLSKERPNFVLMIMGIALFGILLSLHSAFNVWIGLGLFAVLIATLVVSYLRGRKLDELSDVALVDTDYAKYNLLRAIPFAIGGLVFLILGADLLVKGAVSIANSLGVPQAIIGLSVVAVGTSLPELAATFASVRQGRFSLVLGNVLGSNLFNVLGAAGVGAVFGSLSTKGLQIDFVIMALFCLAIGLLLLPKFKRPKLLGVVLILSYAGYIAWLVQRGLV